MDISPVTIGLIGIGVFFLLLAIGLPVGFAMILVGFVGFTCIVSVEAASIKLAMTPFASASSYHFSVIPLFILMAHICFQAGFSKDLYGLANAWLGHLPGGLAMATVGACALFAAISASSLATVVTFALVALPEMKKYNYDYKLSTGAVAAGGTMGVLIPPSGALIIYGLIAEQSIGKLFMAGIIPGILEAIFYMGTILIWCRLSPRLGPLGPKTTFKEKIASFGRIGEILVLIILILGGLFIGWFTPTEAGAVGAFGALVISVARRRLTWQGFKTAIWETMKATGMIYAMIIGALLLNFFMAVSTIPTQLSSIASELPIGPLGIMVFVLIIYIILGCFVDAMAMVLLSIPIFLPLVTGLGFDAIWFGIIVVRMSEIAVITPPVGMNVYTVAGLVKDAPMSTIFKGVIPFIIADICHVALLLFFPQIALFLPSKMMG
jgi:C4-dicarboxylate transporter DctM subunit